MEKSVTIVSTDVAFIPGHGASVLLLTCKCQEKEVEIAVPTAIASGFVTQLHARSSRTVDMQGKEVEIIQRGETPVRFRAPGQEQWTDVVRMS